MSTWIDQSQRKSVDIKKGDVTRQERGRYNLTTRRDAQSLLLPPTLLPIDCHPFWKWTRTDPTADTPAAWGPLSCVSVPSRDSHLMRGHPLAWSPHILWNAQVGAPISTQTLHCDPPPTTWEFKWELSHNRGTMPLDTIGYLPDINSSAKNGWILLEWLVLGIPKILPTKHYRGLSLLLVTIQNLTVRLHCWKHHLFWVIEHGETWHWPGSFVLNG